MNPNPDQKVTIRQLPTGVPGLDELLGGGFPEFSFNLLAGMPGSGKTTLAHQIMFSLANPDRRAIFFTVLGEPPLKMLRYQQQFSFFDSRRLGDSIRFVNLASDLLDGKFDRVLARIIAEVEDFSPELVFVDSFRSIVKSAEPDTSQSAGLEMQTFIQQLGQQMTSWQATTFLIGEYQALEADSSPIFTVADGIVWLTQHVQQDAMVRKLQVVKMRGQAQRPGMHTFRMDSSGLRVFPRLLRKTTAYNQAGEGSAPSAVEAPLLRIQRLSMGNPVFDEMLDGGLPVGYSMLVVGPTGSGKTVLATQFLAEGVRSGEAGVIALFEKSSNQLLRPGLQALVNTGCVGVIDARTLDMSIEEFLYNLAALIKKMDAKRVVIDSLLGFELALASEFQENFREALYRLIAMLNSLGVTVLVIAEMENNQSNDARFSPYGCEFMTDAVFIQRYVELDGQFKRVASVIKVRGSNHSKDIRFYEIHDEGIVIGEWLTGYQAILSGHPVRVDESAEQT